MTMNMAISLSILKNFIVLLLLVASLKLQVFGSGSLHAGILET